MHIKCMYARSVEKEYNCDEFSVFMAFEFAFRKRLPVNDHRRSMYIINIRGDPPRLK